MFSCYASRLVRRVILKRWMLRPVVVLKPKSVTLKLPKFRGIMSQTVNQNVTRKIAKLSRLQISEQEVEQYTKELSKILDFVEQLREVDTENVEPMVHGFALDDHFREDNPIVLSEEETKKIVSCSEQSLYDQYKVPQVIGGE